MTSQQSWRTERSPQDEQIYRRADFGRNVPMGRQPAVLVIDMTRMMFDPSFDLAPHEGAYSVVHECARLVEFGRQAGWPIFWSRRNDRTLAVQRGGIDFKWAADGLPEGADDFTSELMPTPNESVIYKPKPSAFFETPLRSQLAFLGVDTVIVCGMSTSGCVRASVTDAFSCNLRVFVVEEATGDRSPDSHRANLFDMDQKLATVLPFDRLKQLV